MILSLDPGTTESAFVVYDEEYNAFNETTGWIQRKAKLHNADLLRMLWEEELLYSHAVIETVASYGMAVGAEVFETVYWSGRFHEAITRTTGIEPARMYRRDVKLHLCRSDRAKDANIRQAILDRFGGKEKAIGKKKSPGPLYGITADCWQALALAITYADTREKVVTVA